MSLQITFVAETLAALRGLAATFADPAPSLEVFMAAVDTLSAKIREVKDAVEASKTAVLTVVADEKTQVSAAIAALEAKLGEVVTAEQLAGLSGELDGLKAAVTGSDVADAVQGIFVPETPA